ncbi:hypothetical protein FQN52_004815, partial [Onygenales sp. PD_12]
KKSCQEVLEVLLESVIVAHAMHVSYMNIMNDTVKDMHQMGLLNKVEEIKPELAELIVEESKVKKKKNVQMVIGGQAVDLKLTKMEAKKIAILNVMASELKQSREVGETILK